MSRILFLDIDGVLNSSQHMGLRSECALCEDLCWFDPKAVARLNTITDRTKAKIVVSSSWRVGRTVNDLREILEGHGVTGAVIGATPKTFMTRDDTELLGKSTWSVRGEEIAWWLKSVPTSVRSFAIVDDDSDMADVAHRHVKTTWTNGLLDEHVERLISLLMEG